MASIKKKAHKDGSASYEIRVSMGRDINDKQIFKYFTWKPEPDMTARQIERELERQAVLFEERCRSGKVLDTSTKFADFAGKWLEVNKASLSPAYIQRSKALLERINQAIGHIPLDKLRPHHLQSFYENLGEAGVKKVTAGAVSKLPLYDEIKKQGLTRAAVSKTAGLAPNTITIACQGKQISEQSAVKIASVLDRDVKDLFTIIEKQGSLSAKTILHHHRLISSILETAVKWQVLFDNPARRVKSPKVEKTEARYLDDKQAIAVLEALETEPIKWRTIIMLLVYSGMRRGELCGLTWSDIDYDKGVVNIRKASQYLPGEGIFEKDTKTDSSNRVISLPESTFAMLKKYEAWQSQERLRLGDQWQDTGKVFTQENGLPIHPDSITGWVAKFRECHGLPDFSPHSLRHTNATMLIMSGVPVKAVSSRLGHSSQNVTNMVYSHAIQTMDAMASEKIEDILNPRKNLTKTSQSG